MARVDAAITGDANTLAGVSASSKSKSRLQLDRSDADIFDSCCPTCDGSEAGVDPVGHADGKACHDGICAEWGGAAAERDESRKDAGARHLRLGASRCPGEGSPVCRGRSGAVTDLHLSTIPGSRVGHVARDEDEDGSAP